jgi:predicted MFS family arabinose efflux permease
MASGTGQALINFAGGLLIAAWGFGRFFLPAGSLTFVAAVLFWAYFRNSRRAAPPSEAAAGEPPEAEALSAP